MFIIDEAFEYSAPTFYDFIHGESEEDVFKAELWFEKALSHAPSPFVPRIKATRAAQIQILCSFGEDEQHMLKVMESPSISAEDSAPLQDKTKPQDKHVSTDNIEVIGRKPCGEADNVDPSEPKENISIDSSTDNTEAVGRTPCAEADNVDPSEPKENVSINSSTDNTKASGRKPCTDNVNPSEAKENVSINSSKKNLKFDITQDVSAQGPPPQKHGENKRVQTDKKVASMVRNPSSMKPKNNKLQKAHGKCTKPLGATRDTPSKNVEGNPNVAHENHAIKRQKLKGGKTRQILTVNKPLNLPHKTKSGIDITSSNICVSTSITSSKEDRKMYVREQATQFVSMAEMMRKFQSQTRDLSLPHNNSSLSLSNAGGVLKTKPKLKLTRPKTPEFKTSERTRTIKAKSTAELEQEMIAKMPKFKARPINRKIFEAPNLGPLPRSTCHPLEFKEFHLETTSRVNNNAETSTEASIEPTEIHIPPWKPHLTARKAPLLQTSLRARPPKIKSSEELEKEELEKMPQFKAKPLNKKILESKGDMGMFSNMKKPITIPQEFNFAIDKRIPPPPAVADMFDKLSICSETRQEKRLPSNTTPSPFHLHTEERGAEKEKKLLEELIHKQLEEEKVRIPKVHPYPYTTDYPEIPPKPATKPCTKPEPFQLESLLRHEEEMHREMEEKRMMEMEEAQMRVFKAQPVLKEDPIPVPEKVRKPLTEVQEFNLHADHRAADRAEFDKKIKEKEKVYKRHREEAVSLKMMEEEKALKQLRRTLVPHARPVPSFDCPFLPQRSSKGVTKAKSPQLGVNRRKERQRVLTVATSSRAAASNMR